MTRPEAEDVIESARQSARALALTGLRHQRVFLGAGLPESDVDLLADLSGAVRERHETVICGRVVLVMTASVDCDGVEIAWQGSRPLVAADLEVST